MHVLGVRCNAMATKEWRATEFLAFAVLGFLLLFDFVALLLFPLLLRAYQLSCPVSSRLGLMPDSLPSPHPPYSVGETPDLKTAKPSVIVRVDSELNRVQFEPRQVELSRRDRSIHPTKKPFSFFLLLCFLEE